MVEHHAVLRKGPRLRRESREAGARWLWLQYHLRELYFLHLLLLVESLRRRHRRQLRLYHTRLIDPRRASSRRVRVVDVVSAAPNLGRVRFARH